MKNPKEQTVFIVGAPRSGTTILGDVLEAHPRVASWYEPYFVLDRYFRGASDDVREAQEATRDVKTFARQEFARYRRARGKPVVVDKSPRNSLKIPFLREIFPQAKFIHIQRDGRDTVLSMHKKWRDIEKAVDERNVKQAMLELYWLLARQPLWRHKWQALMFERGTLTFWQAVRLQLRNLQRIQAWDGRTGWGPQFRGWREVIDDVSTIEFNAYQWRACLEGILEAREKLQEDGLYLRVSYEDLLEYPKRELGRIFDYLEVEFPQDFFKSVPPLKSGNYNKWEQGLTGKQKQQVGPIIQPILKELGYTKDDNWFA